MKNRTKRILARLMMTPFYTCIIGLVLLFLTIFVDNFTHSLVLVGVVGFIASAIWLVVKGEEILRDNPKED